MNSIIKFGTSMCKTGFFNVGKQLRLSGFKGNNVLAFSRSMWHMLPSSDEKFLKIKPVTECCHCGCSGLLHTKGEKSLVDFLKGEIDEERKSQKMVSLPKTLNEFNISADRAELLFEKKNQIETITVSMNVNHSMDTDENISEESFSDEMKARPTFEVDITKNNCTLNFCCSYVNFREHEGEKYDVYQIDEISLYEGEWNEKNYSVAGDILDENLYDLFMSLLSEKGITNEFMEQVSEIATFYEHSKYIGLLEDIHKFTSAN